MSNKPIITIITATYNADLTLDQCIRSVSEQTDNRFEYIIVDGGSKDNTLEIIKRNSNVITKYISEKDKGIYDAWNKGIKLSSGKWIAFLGADDLLFSDAIEKYVNFIEKINGEKMDLISANNLYVDENLNPIKTIGQKWEWKHFKKRMCIAHVMSLHNRELFERVGFFNTEFKISADYELLLRLGKNLKTGYLNETVAKMRIGGASFSYKACNELFKIKYKSRNRNVINLIFEYCVLIILFTRKRMLIKIESFIKA